jgi:hypothetical protein
MDDALMAKKQPRHTSSKPAPQKKLRLIDYTPIGLTEPQRAEFRERYRALMNIGGSYPNLSDRKACHKIVVERLLWIYIEALCTDPGAQKGQLTRNRQFVNVRRSIVRELGKLVGRELSPTDIVRELAKHAPVPDYAEAAIRRDYLRVTV